MPVLTFLDRRATERRYQCEFGGPSSFEGLLNANDPEINILHDEVFLGGDFPPFAPEYPFVAEGVRLLHWFRREEPEVGGPWVPRFGGFMRVTRDTGDPNVARTRFTAYDPWQVLFHRPVYRVECLNQDCSSTQDYLQPQDALPGPDGVGFLEGTELQDIALEILRRTIDLDGPCGIDAGTAWGGTAFYDGTIQTLAPITENLIFQQGTSVGEAWQALMDTGYIEIVVRPIYDPENRPGYVAELDIFDSGSAGTYPGGDYPLNQPAWSWDRSGHDLMYAERVVDGNERANHIQFYIGGPAGGKVGVQLVEDLESVSRYGNEWLIETRLRTLTGESVLLQAEFERERRKAGEIVWSLTPTPEWTFRPFQDYDLGTYISVYHSRRLREEVWDFPRIRSFGVELSDNGVETVTGLEVWTDF